MPDLENASPETIPPGTPNGAGGADGGTVQTDGQAAGQGAPESESFLPKDFNPNTLPPEVRAMVDKINKDMVRGFTEKTSKLSETVKSETAKAVEAYKAKAERFDQLAQQEDFVKQWNEYVQKASQSNDPNKVNLPPEVLKALDEVKEVKNKLQVAETNEIVNAFSEAVNEKGEKLHPDFEKLSGFSLGTHEKAGEYNLLRAAVELAPGSTPQEKLENGYKAAKATYDAIFEEGKKAGMGRVQEKARNGSQPPSGVNAGSTAPGRPKDALEALKFARQGLAVNKG